MRDSFQLFDIIIALIAVKHTVQSCVSIYYDATFTKITVAATFVMVLKVFPKKEGVELLDL